MVILCPGQAPERHLAQRPQGRFGPMPSAAAANSRCGGPASRAFGRGNPEPDTLWLVFLLGARNSHRSAATSAGPSPKSEGATARTQPRAAKGRDPWFPGLWHQSRQWPGQNHRTADRTAGHHRHLGAGMQRPEFGQARQTNDLPALVAKPPRRTAGAMGYGTGNAAQGGGQILHPQNPDRRGGNVPMPVMYKRWRSPWVQSGG